MDQGRITTGCTFAALFTLVLYKELLMPADCHIIVGHDYEYAYMYVAERAFQAVFIKFKTA